MNGEKRLVEDINKEDCKSHLLNTPSAIINYYLKYHTPIDIYQELSQNVFGQQKQLKKIITLVYGYLKDTMKNDLSCKPNFIVSGKSGSGKTTIFTYLKKALFPIPVEIVDGSSISPAGYRGNDVSNIIPDSFEDFGGYGILVLDEIDKIFGQNSIKDNYHVQRQECFLKLLDGGTIIDGSRSIDASKILIVGLGAFSFLRKDNTTENNSIGFLKTDNKNYDNKELNRNQIFGNVNSEQFIGRFKAVIDLDEPTMNMCMRVGRKVVNEISDIYGKEVAEGFYKQGILQDIVKKSYQSQYGCRNVTNSIWEFFLNNMIDDVVFKNKKDKLYVSA